MSSIAYTVEHISRDINWSALAHHKKTICRITIIGTWMMLLAMYGKFEALTLSNQQLYALTGGVAGLMAATLGTIPAILLQRQSKRIEDTMLGLSAGIMLGASAFSLILPGIEAATGLNQSRINSTMLVVTGLITGAAAMLLLDRLIPHAHPHTELPGVANSRLTRAWLITIAIALHNLPEGVAIGVGFSQADPGLGFPLSGAIALQDIPEGFAVTMAMRSAGISKPNAIAAAMLSGITEPIGAMFGVSLCSMWDHAYPLALVTAGGAMLFVVCHEIIPETRRSSHQSNAITGLIVGFSLMTML